MKCIEDVEGEGALRPCDGRWEATESQDLNMPFRSSRCIMASAELNVDSVDT